MYYQMAPFGVDELDTFQTRTLERRMMTYSKPALLVAEGIGRIFVAYPAFQRSLNALDRAFQLSRATPMPQGVVLTGPTGTGKSSLAKYFIASLPNDSLFEAGLGVVSIRLQERPSLGRVVSTLLTQLRYPLPQVKGSTIASKRDVLIGVLRMKGTRLLLIDEAGHMCVIGLRRAQNSSHGNEITELFRELIDEASIGVGLLGDERLRSLAQLDPALAARVSTHEHLPDFSMDGLWAGFVRSFVKQCASFDLNFLVEPQQLPLIYRATGGNPRRFKGLVMESVLVATDSSQTTLSQELMDIAFERLNGSASLAINPYKTSRAAEPSSRATA